MSRRTLQVVLTVITGIPLTLYFAGDGTLARVVGGRLTEDSAGGTAEE